MTLTSWLLIFEIIVGVGLLIWLVFKAYNHVKRSPAEEALRQQLIELETAKTAPKTSKNSKAKKKAT